MASAFGWFGPLIDLSTASSHIGDFVQLLVFVHRSTPIQYKSSKGGQQIRTHIQVGDDTGPFFGVSVWQNNMGSIISPGDVILLQNVKIVKFGDIVEARTVQWSSLLCLIHPYASLISKDIEELVAGCRVGITTRDKLRKVIKWVQQSRSSICNINSYASYQQTRQLSKNWKVLEEMIPKDCFTLSEVSQLTSSCKAVVCAFIGEVFLQVSSMVLGDTEKAKIFLSRRVYKSRDNNLVEDLICTGCQLCGSPMGSEFEKNNIPLSCTESSSRLHDVRSIYRPFMLYVWDESDYMPILVKNRAAEILFGNIKAEKVYSSYYNQADSREGLLGCNSIDADKGLQLAEKQHHVINNFYDVWLIFLKMLLQQGKNSPLKFEITVDPSSDIENGKFEMVCAALPCQGTM